MLTGAPRCSIHRFSKRLHAVLMSFELVIVPSENVVPVSVMRKMVRLTPRTVSNTKSTCASMLNASFT